MSNNDVRTVMTVQLSQFPFKGKMKSFIFDIFSYSLP